MLAIIDLLAGFECCGAAFEILGILADVGCWIRGARNRVERRNARKLGRPRIPLDKWNIAFLVIAGVIVVSTTILLVVAA